MRLIDADELKKEFKDSPIGLAMQKLVDTQPTAYDIDKVVDKLEEIEAKYSDLSCSVNDITMMREYTAKEQTMALAIEIVKQGVR